MEFEVAHVQCCGSLYGVRLSVTAPDLGRDNMRVSQASISLSAGWDTHVGVLPEKAKLQRFFADAVQQQ